MRRRSRHFPEREDEVVDTLVQCLDLLEAQIHCYYRDASSFVKRFGPRPKSKRSAVFFQYLHHALDVLQECIREQEEKEQRTGETLWWPHPPRALSGR